MRIKAKNYATRADLEVVAIASDASKDTIEGTRDELARLKLSDQTTVYGVKCVITDNPTKIEPQREKPDRGRIFKHGINLNEG